MGLFDWIFSIGNVIDSAIKTVSSWIGSADVVGAIGNVINTAARAFVNTPLARTVTAAATTVANAYNFINRTTRTTAPVISIVNNAMNSIFRAGTVTGKAQNAAIMGRQTQDMAKTTIAQNANIKNTVEAVNKVAQAVIEMQRTTPIVQYASGEDYRAAKAIADKLGAGLLFTRNIEDIDQYAYAVIVGGQGINPIFKWLVDKKLFFPIESKHEKETVVEYASTTWNYPNEMKYRKKVYGAAGWHREGTMRSAQHIVNYGLPKDKTIIIAGPERSAEDIKTVNDWAKKPIWEQIWDAVVDEVPKAVLEDAAPSQARAFDAAREIGDWVFLDLPSFGLTESDVIHVPYPLIGWLAFSALGKAKNLATGLSKLGIKSTGAVKLTANLRGKALPIYEKMLTENLDDAIKFFGKLDFKAKERLLFGLSESPVGKRYGAILLNSIGTTATGNLASKVASVLGKNWGIITGTLATIWGGAGLTSWLAADNGLTNVVKSAEFAMNQKDYCQARKLIAQGQEQVELMSTAVRATAWSWLWLAPYWTGFVDEQNAKWNRWKDEIEKYGDVGQLQINANKSISRVILNGNQLVSDYMDTGATFKAVPVGKNLPLQVESKDNEVYEKTIDINQCETTTVPINFAEAEKTTGMIRINWTGKSASVYADGKYIGKTNQDIPMPEGKYIITVDTAKYGYEQPAPIEITLTRDSPFIWTVPQIETTVGDVETVEGNQTKFPEVSDTETEIALRQTTTTLFVNVNVPAYVEVEGVIMNYNFAPSREVVVSLLSETDRPEGYDIKVYRAGYTEYAKHLDELEMNKVETLDVVLDLLAVEPKEEPPKIEETGISFNVPEKTHIILNGVTQTYPGPQMVNTIAGTHDYKLSHADYGIFEGNAIVQEGTITPVTVNPTDFYAEYIWPEDDEEEEDYTTEVTEEVPYVVIPELEELDIYPPSADTSVVPFVSPLSKELVVNIETTGLNPLDSRIYAIGFRDAADMESKPTALVNADEETLIRQFIQFFESSGYKKIIGYNFSFDYRFIYSRCLRYRIQAPTFMTIEISDVMQKMAQVKEQFMYNPQKSYDLDSWSLSLLGIKAPTDNDGLQNYYLNQDWTSIAKYVSYKVDVTHKIWALDKYVKGFGTTAPEIIAKTVGTITPSGSKEVECAFCNNKQIVSGDESSYTCEECGGLQEIL